jgi:dipeptidyl aminopeptidase/acylaminoacyl peptidase
MKMMNSFGGLAVLLLPCLNALSQQQPLDHTVYDGWQNIGEKILSHDGKMIVYTVSPQEGDGVLIIQNPVNQNKKEIPRGYHAMITADNRFVIGLIRPLFKDTRDSKIKKKKPDEMPKDSLFIFEPDKDTLIKIPRVKTYQTPQKGSGWLAWMSFAEPAPAPSVTPAPVAGVTPTPAAAVKASPPDTSLTLTLRNLITGEERKFKNARDYLFSKKGHELVVATTRKNDDTLSQACVLWVGIPSGHIDTVMKKFNDARNFAFDEDAGRLAFVAERDSTLKALQKFYTCWYYTPGMDSAEMIVSRSSPAVAKGITVSENYALHFSKTGRRLLLGLAPIRPVRDTTVPDFEKAAVDIWNYKDDDLQPVQLKNLDKDLKKSWLALWDIDKRQLRQLGDEKFPDIEITDEGDGTYFYAGSDFGRRVAKQWQGYTLSDIYVIDTRTGEKKLIVRDLKGSLYPSSTGKYLLLYDDRQRGYSIYDATTGAVQKAGADIRTPLYDEENDVPDDPAPYGIAGWEKGDRHVFVYDRYDIWSVDANGKERSMYVSPMVRTSKTVFRYVPVDTTQKFIDPAKPFYCHVYNDSTKESGYIRFSSPRLGQLDGISGGGPYSVGGLVKADSADAYIFTKENFSASPDIYYLAFAFDSFYRAQIPGWHTILLQPVQVSHINPQQSNYLWGSAELFTWKAYTGRRTEGILYKPANFDPGKKYPMIVYFYERYNNTLYNYQAPAPTPSRLNIPFFVSRGYLVFVPDIWYTTGHPGKSASDYIMSGTRALIKKGFVDSTRLGIQGQSWGGYQAAYLITRTNLFAAAWAGAPVVDMFSAYGGIRWESGLNRQMQYEKSQSRIGATIWDRPDLYIENSPLFHLPKVKTPLVIMSNDADGAVPWYQGIEFFTAMRRLNKPVWLLQYNGEAHNLVERRNRKDIQIREQQYFDWLLKGAPAPKWIREGVPAVLKGIDWGTGTE